MSSNKFEVQLFTTLKCNLRCSYCVMEVGDILSSQGKANYSIDELKKFISTHLGDRELYFTFFGGEPLLNIPFIESVMQSYPNAIYNIQTNGTLFTRTPDHIIKRMDNFLISIDGGEQITDKYRGKDTWNKVIENAVHIKRIAKPGTLVARMTYCDPDLTYEEIVDLLNVFDYVHFQFAQYDGVYEIEHMKKKYKVVRQMVDDFFIKNGEVNIIPVMGILRNKVFPEYNTAQGNGKAQCRVSTNLANIRPDGSIYGCPDMTWVPEMEHGNVKENRFSTSPLQMHPNMPCHTCPAKSWCHGNCMKNLWVAYVMKDDKYRNNVVDPVCNLVRYMGNCIDAWNPAEQIKKFKPETIDRIKNTLVYDFVEIIP